MTAQNDPKPEQSLETHSIVLFDGVCRFCNGWVQFILRHDQHDTFRFAPLQSDYAIQLLATGILKNENESLDSVILCEGRSVYTHSSAVLQICKRLGVPGACSPCSQPYLNRLETLSTGSLPSAGIAGSVSTTAA